MRSRYVLGAGGLSVLIGFLLPWISVRISPQALGSGIPIPTGLLDALTARFSGLALMTGPTVTVPIIGAIQVAPAAPSLGLVLLTGLLAVACAVCPDQHRAALLLRAATLASGVVAVPLFWLKTGALRLPAPIDAILPPTVEPAFWACLFGLGLAVIAAALLLLRGRGVDTDELPDNPAGPGGYSRTRRGRTTPPVRPAGVQRRALPRLPR